MAAAEKKLKSSRREEKMNWKGKRGKEGKGEMEEKKGEERKKKLLSGLKMHKEV